MIIIRHRQRTLPKKHFLEALRAVVGLVALRIMPAIGYQVLRLRLQDTEHLELPGMQ